jgi:outer membrane immunogenic protein
VRAGFLATPAFLIYATGGAAYGGVHTTGFAQGTINDASVGSGLPATVNGSNARVGWTGGGGIEWMFLPNWSLKGEALYYDLGRFRTSFGEVTSVATVGGGHVASALTVATFRERGVISRRHQLPLLLGSGGSGRRPLLNHSVVAAELPSPRHEMR